MARRELPSADYSDMLELDLGEVVPSIAGPKRPQDRVALSDAQRGLPPRARRLRPRLRRRDEASAETSPPAIRRPTKDHPGEDAGPSYAHGAGGERGASVAGPPRLGASGERARAAGADDGRGRRGARRGDAADGTETTRPRPRGDRGDHELHEHLESSVMIGAGILARNALARGPARKPWVKTSLAPGSKVVTEYLDRAGLTEPLEQLGFNLVGYGCTTCIGNSGPLPEEISKVGRQGGPGGRVGAVGQPQLRGRIHPDVKMNYLASPPLCVAYALAGTMDIDIVDEPLGQDEQGNDVYLRDIWPREREVAETIEQAVQSGMFRKSYGEVFEGDERWQALEVPTGERFAWEGLDLRALAAVFPGDAGRARPVEDITGARVLACSATA